MFFNQFKSTKDSGCLAVSIMFCNAYTHQPVFLRQMVKSTSVNKKIKKDFLMKKSSKGDTRI